MTWFLTSSLGALCLALVVWGLSNPSRFLQFPFLAACAVGMQIVPQFLALATTEDRLPPGALPPVILMTTLCLAMSAAGYFASAHPPALLRWEFDSTRLAAAAGLLVAVGILGALLLRSLPAEMTNSSQWSGLPVRYVFFADAGRYGFAILLLLYLRTGKRWVLPLLLPGLYSAMVLLLAHGRRTPTAIFLLTVLSAFWFARRRAVPRWAMAAGVVGFTLFAFSVGEYRLIMRDATGGKWERIARIRFSDKIKTEGMLEHGSAEMRNAVHCMEAATRTGTYDFGLRLCDAVVAAYVPRQLVGKAFKDSLFLAPDMWAMTHEALGYTPPLGSCPTGVAQAYVSFSYAGCLLFAVAGYIMRRLWEGGMADSLLHQVMYMIVVALQIGMFNGNISQLVVPWVHMGLFIGPAAILARARASPPRRATIPHAVASPSAPPAVSPPLDPP